MIAAKTTEPHPKLPGTIYTAAKEGEVKYICLVHLHMGVRVPRRHCLKHTRSEDAGIFATLHAAPGSNL